MIMPAGMTILTRAAGPQRIGRVIAIMGVPMLLGPVFGAFLLLPLYFQAVRGESPLMAGVLLAPQGLGSMITMPIAGQLSDKIGSGRIVPVGLIGVLASVVWLTQIGAHTSWVAICIDLFVFGLGMGFAMMPIFTGAMQSVSAAAAARASTALNIIQQTGASIGTAVLSVLLATELADQLGHGSHGTIGATAVSASVRAHIAGPMATAFGHSFVWACALLGIALVGSLTLPRRRPEFASAAPDAVPL